MNASGGARLVAVTRHALAEREGATFFQEISKKMVGFAQKISTKLSLSP
jgi:hypothetical protein